MKSKVLSIRIRLDLLVSCYHILELSGLPAKGAKQGTAVVTAINRLCESLAHEGKLPVYTSEGEIEAKLQEYIGTWAGPSEVVFNSELPVAQDTPVDAPGVDSRRGKLIALIEQRMAEDAQREEEAFSAAVKGATVFNPATVLPAVNKPQGPIWETSTKVPEASVEADELYLAAKDELMQLAIRTVYVSLPVSLWSSDTAERLSAEVYQHFIEAQEGKC